MSISKALKENLFLIYACAKLIPWVSPKVAIILLHNISVVLLIYSLIKYVKLEYVLIVLLLFYVTFFLNQFRQVFSMTFVVLSLIYLNRNFGLTLLFLIIALASHISAIFVLPIILIKLQHFKSQLVSKIIVVLACIIAIIALILLVNEKNRFDFYFEKTNNFSYMFLLVALFLGLQWHYLEKSLKIYFSILFVFVLGSCFLMSFSARLGEYALFLILINSTVANKNASLRQTNQEIVLLLIVSLCFFTYRFFNWFFLDTQENLRFYFKQIILFNEF